MIERFVIRVIVAFFLGGALLAFVLAPIPVDEKGDPELPAPAFHQTSLYRLESALLVFYGGLLLVTPAFSGLTRGRLPIEISTRGAKFAEASDKSAARTEAAIDELGETTDDLSQRLTATQLEIERLHELAGSDSKQPRLDSKR